MIQHLYRNAAPASNTTNLVIENYEAIKFFNRLNSLLCCDSNRLLKARPKNLNTALNAKLCELVLDFIKMDFNYHQKYKLNNNFIKRSFADFFKRYFPQLNGYFTACSLKLCLYFLFFL